MNLGIWREAIRDRYAAYEAKQAVKALRDTEGIEISDEARALYDVADGLEDKARDSYQAVFEALAPRTDTSREAVKRRANIERVYWNIVGFHTL